MKRQSMVAAIAISVAAFGCIPTAQADDEVWTIIRTTKGVEKLSDAGDWVPLRKEDAVYPGDNIRTGKRARIKLQFNGSVIQVRPETVIRLPENSGVSSEIRVHQLVGEARYEIEKREHPHFSVETPYFAAVVKGTKFDIEVGSKKSNLRVREGVVEVGDYDTGERLLLNRNGRIETRHEADAGLNPEGDVAQLPPVQAAVSPVVSSLEQVAPSMVADAADSEWHPTAGYRGVRFDEENDEFAELLELTFEDEDARSNDDLLVETDGGLLDDASPDPGDPADTPAEDDQDEDDPDEDDPEDDDPNEDDPEDDDPDEDDPEDDDPDEDDPEDDGPDEDDPEDDDPDEDDPEDDDPDEDDPEDDDPDEDDPEDDDPDEDDPSGEDN